MADHTLNDLQPDPRNVRKHNPRNIGMVERALKEVGAARSIVVDEDGTVLAGNATVEAAKAAGIKRVQIVDADGETIIAVRRAGLTDEQKQRLALFDNRAAELADWDTEALAEIVAEDEAILKDIFSENEINMYLDDPDVSFDSFDEGIAEDVEYHECPECGHNWPK